MTTKIRVCIVDDHQIFIDGIASLFIDDNIVDIVGHATNKTELIKLLHSISIDVILLDLNLGDIDGINILKEIKSNHYNQKIIVLTMYNLPNLVKKVKENGGDGYLLKNTSKSELKKAILAVCSGENYFDGELSNHAKQNSKLTFESYPDNFLKLHNLSKREYEIIILLSESYSTKEIAETLHISEQTVSTYRKNIKSKMNFKTTTDIVRFVFENKLN